MAFIYSFVARGTLVLADYTSYSGNFSTVAIQCLQKCPASQPGDPPNKVTFNADRHTFNYLVDSGYVYMVVADVALGRSLPYAFLDRIRSEFQEKFAEKAEDLSVAHSLDKSFGPRLKAMMEYVVSHQEEFNKVALVQRKVDDVKNVMNENVYKVLDRGEKIDILVDKTENMQTQANKFNKAGSALRSKMFWANVRAKMFFILIAAGAVLALFFAVCGDCLAGAPPGAASAPASAPAPAPAPGPAPGPAVALSLEPSSAVAITQTLLGYEAHIATHTNRGLLDWEGSQ